MSTQEPGASPSPNDVISRAIDLVREENYADALGLFESNLTVLGGGDLTDKRLAASAFSFYGLCVAMVNHRYADGIEYCNVSIRSNPYEPAHRLNQALIYLERDDRKNAIETLSAGLRLQPRNSRINTILDRLGRRRPPVITFLSRDNPLNVWLGRRRHDTERGRRR